MSINESKAQQIYYMLYTKKILHHEYDYQPLKAFHQQYMPLEFQSFPPIFNVGSGPLGVPVNTQPGCAKAGHLG